ncbi:phosphoglycerate mutase-like protein isoform X2 [Eutrema salsugineum]|uniref:phosphoglycerate mutase-like protein isoform X2 n=1 Tax=Eutrema salsugineum TaxID=72664 RepID=UPI000CED5547|nr:phosphoglycerate mutase-like protein isoform X2 [Eutrema salsugineum]
MELCGVQTLRLLPPNFKTLHLVRHAQGIHNVELEENEESSPLSEELFDAHLSPKGLQQVCERRQKIIESGLLNTIELVITSPLRRAMQTSTGIFKGQETTNESDNFPKANNFPPIVALEICRERMGLYPCDRRERISTHRTCFSEIDFTMIESDEDVLWQAGERENLEEVSARGLRFLTWLWERPEKEIAVVSHGIFLQQTLRALHEKVGIPLEDSFLTRFANCELRSIRIEKSAAIWKQIH